MGFFTRWRQKARDDLTPSEALERSATIQQALQIQVLDKHQAEVNSREGETAARLIQALEGVPAACITVGSIVVVKHEVNGEPLVRVRQLSAIERKALEQFPDLHKRPERFFEALADAVALPPINDSDGM